GSAHGSVDRVHLQSVLSCLRRGERQFSVDVEKRFGRGGVSPDLVFCAGEVEVKFRVLISDADISVAAPNFGVGEIAETVVVDSHQGSIDRHSAALHARFSADLFAAKRAKLGIDVSTLEIE